MSDTPLALRLAELDDCRFYWEVNNAPATRALSLSSEPIPYDGHQRWYATKLAENRATLYVAEVDSTRVGVVRFERDEEGGATISVALSGSFQGRGLGRRIIAEGTRLTLKSDDINHVTAYIRPDNLGSVKAFAAAGFQPAGEGVERGVSILRYVAR